RREHAAEIVRAVSIPPVKLILSTPGCATNAAPAWPSPGTTLITPAGTPASRASDANSNGVNGANSDGFTTTQHPAASAGITEMPIEAAGPFQVRITATTP